MRMRALSWLIGGMGIAVFLLAREDKMSLSAVRAKHANINLAGKVAVVVGGTSGIGTGIALRLAQADASVVIVGRSKERAEEVLARLRQASKTATHNFIACDARLIANVVAFSAEFSKLHTTLDYLVVTQAAASLGGRKETEEGIDTKLSLHYYSRVAFAEALAPLMNGPDPRVLSVLSAGVHSPYQGYATDPALKTSYSLSNAANAAGFYNDIAVEALAKEHPNISYIHAAPGMVSTNWGSEMPLPVRAFVRFVMLFARSLEDCGEYMSSALFDPEFKGGWSLIGRNAQKVSKTQLHDQARDAVWAHTKSTIDPLLAQQQQQQKGQE